MSEVLERIEDYCVVVFFDGSMCSRPTAAIVTTGCVHEHLTIESMCTQCIEAGERGGLVCLTCEGGEQRHTCYVRTLKVEPRETITE